jgi:hypothetical protein
MAITFQYVLFTPSYSVSVYSEALVLSERCEADDKTMPTIQRVHIRVKRLERAAIASQVFALIHEVWVLFNFLVS